MISFEGEMEERRKDFLLLSINKILALGGFSIDGYVIHADVDEFVEESSRWT